MNTMNVPRPEPESEYRLVLVQAAPAPMDQLLFLEQQDEQEGIATVPLHRPVGILVNPPPRGQGPPPGFNLNNLTVSLFNPNSWIMTNPRFEFKGILGQGSYGTVSKVFDRTLNKEVAIKEVLYDNRSRRPNDLAHYKSTLREISILKFLGKHKNIVELYEYCKVPTTRTNLILLEFLEMDLKKYMERYYFGGRMDLVRVRTLGHQLMTGVNYMHSKGIMHRDLKPSNLLISPQTETLKITDFGLACSFSVPDRVKTIEVVSLWYRPPELLLKVEDYGPEIDMWSAGCIIFELLTGYPAFPGPVYADKQQLGLIFYLMGSPTEMSWPGVTMLLIKAGIGYIDYSPGFLLQRYPVLRENLKSYNLVMNMLVCDPKQRITSQAVLMHPFFKSEKVSVSSLNDESETSAGAETVKRPFNCSK